MVQTACRFNPVIGATRERRLHGAGGSSVLFDVALVVFFGAVERWCITDFGDDRSFVPPAGIALLFRCFREPALLIVVDEDRRAVLRTNVGPLTVERGWIVHVPKRIEQLFIADGVGIEINLDGLCMTGVIAAHFFIGRVGRCPTAITNSRIDNTANTSEMRLDAPETTGCKCRLLKIHNPSHLSSFQNAQAKTA